MALNWGSTIRSAEHLSSYSLHVILLTIICLCHSRSLLFGFGMATLYYYQSTPSSGSADPLRRSIEMRTLFSDGLGAARGQRLRKGSCASYPTRLFFASRATRPRPGPPFLLSPSASALHPKSAVCADIFISCSQMNALGMAGLVKPRGFARQVKAINSIARTVMVFLLIALAPNQVSRCVARAGEPALPELKAETQAVFEHYVKLAEARNEGELKRGTGLLWVDGLPEEQRADAYAALK